MQISGAQGGQSVHGLKQGGRSRPTDQKLLKKVKNAKSLKQLRKMLKDLKKNPEKLTPELKAAFEKKIDQLKAQKAK